MYDKNIKPNNIYKGIINSNIIIFDEKLLKKGKSTRKQLKQNRKEILFIY